MSDIDLTELFAKSPRIVSLLWVKEIQLWFAWELTPVGGFIPTGECHFQDREGQYWFAHYEMYNSDMQLIKHFQAMSECWDTTYIDRPIK
jgi:hypothetical protein